jgi:hypothetical protein
LVQFDHCSLRRGFAKLLMLPFHCLVTPSVEENVCDS